MLINKRFLRKLKAQRSWIVQRTHPIPPTLSFRASQSPRAQGFSGLRRRSPYGRIPYLQFL